MKYEADFETHVCGIPCGVVVVDFQHAPPNRNCTDSDIDYYGYTECEWFVVDRTGYKAEWLEKKMSEKDSLRIDDEVFDYYKNDSY